MEKVKMYEPMNFEVDVWDGITENKVYAAYDDDGVAYSVVDLMGNSERIYKSKVFDVQPCAIDESVAKSVRTLCIAMNQRAKLDREIRQRTKDSDDIIAERKRSLAVATGLMTAEKFEETLGVALDHKYGGDISVKVVSDFNKVATVHIIDTALVRKYPTLDEFKFLSTSYGPKKFHVNRESSQYHSFAQEYAPEAKDYLESLSCGTIVGADIGANNALVAFRRYTIKLDAGLTIASVNRIISEVAVAVA